MSDRTTVIASVEFPTYYGGIGTIVYELARNWHAMGERLTAVVKYNGEADREFDARQGYGIVRVIENGGKPSKFRARIRAMRRVVEEQRPAAIYASDWRAGLVSWLVARGQVPYVVAAYGSEFTARGGTPIDGLVQRWVMRHVRRVLCVSGYTREMAIGHGAPADRSVVMPVGSDPDRFLPADRAAAKRGLGFEGRTVLLTVARLVRRKGHATVLRALPAVVARVPDALYVIAGAGPMQAELEELVSELGMGEHVRFLGEVAYDRDVPSLYPAADVFVLTSESDTTHGVEGFGIVFLEAGCCETPVVGSRAGGIPDAIEDGVTGYLVDAGSPDQMADALIRILSDPDLARRMGRAGRERVLRDFTWRRIAERTLDQLYG